MWLLLTATCRSPPTWTTDLLALMQTYWLMLLTTSQPGLTAWGFAKTDTRRVTCHVPSSRRQFWESGFKASSTLLFGFWESIFTDSDVIVDVQQPVRERKLPSALPGGLPPCLVQFLLGDGFFGSGCSQVLLGLAQFRHASG